MSISSVPGASPSNTTSPGSTTNASIPGSVSSTSPSFTVNSTATAGSLSATNYYQVYIQDTIALAGSIIIKSNDAANGLNNYVNAQALFNGTSEVDTTDPTSWKYYLNLSGQYHATDTIMSVVSLDTLETIDFTVGNLALNTATAAGYAYGTYNYNQLVSQYPTQELLILGILYPVNIEVAIAAAEGTILGFPPNLVESNEYSLITNLQKWINGYKERWVNSQFAISDTLYPATSLGIMYLNLVPAIINLRLRACKTNEAHSFHVRMYLASHGFLDQYIDIMTNSQTLFFYRNIAYIERNSGKQATFDWIVQHIMTERGLPLSQFTMQHNLANQPTQLLPTLAFVKSSVNGLVSVDDQTSFTLDQVLTLEDPLATGNVAWHANEETNIQQAMQNSLSNVLLTKVLESTVIDYSNSSPYNLTDILMNHWLWLSANGNYIAVVNVINPVSGEAFALTVKDAYVLAWYCLLQQYDIDIVNVPQMYAKRVQRFNPGVDSVADLMTVVDPNYVSLSTAQLAISIQPTITSIISTSAFYSTCQAIYNSAQLQRNLTSFQENDIARGMVAGLCNRIYSDNVCTLTTVGETYAQWLSDRNINLGGFTTADYNALYTSLVGQATGSANQTSTTLEQIQAAMIAMLQQLSSYSIQFITQTNNTAFQETDWTVVRVGNQYGSTSDSVALPDMVATVISDSCSVSEELKFDTNLCSVTNFLTEEILNEITYPIGAPGILPTNTVLSQYSYLFAAPIGPRVVGLTKNNLGIIPVPGLDIFLGLTPAQQQNLPSVSTSNV